MRQGEQICEEDSERKAIDGCGYFEGYTYSGKLGCGGGPDPRYWDFHLILLINDPPPPVV